MNRIHLRGQLRFCSHQEHYLYARFSPRTLTWELTPPPASPPGVGVEFGAG